jgi:hypothetical protein
MQCAMPVIRQKQGGRKHVTTVTVNGLGQFNNTIQTGDIGRDLVAADVVGPNSEIDVNGIGNVVFLGLDGESSDGIIRLTGINNEGVSFSPGTMFFLNGVGNIAATNFDDFVSVIGVNNIVRTVGGGIVVEDHGLGTIFQILEASHLTIQDFQNDATGIINLGIISRIATPAQAVAAETSDGHGGTMLSLPGVEGFPPSAITTTIDFVGDPHVAISHFV